MEYAATCRTGLDALVGSRLLEFALKVNLFMTLFNLDLD